MILKAILLGLVAMLGHTNFLFGTNLLDRPLIMCTLTGLVMGDLKSGIIIGAMMELAFIGAFSVGASLPPDMISGGVLGAALTLAAGNDPEVALTIGVPIASLALLMKNACKIFILPIFVHKADDYAVKEPLVAYANVKFGMKSGVGSSKNNNSWPLMRVEEMILIEAECLAQTGNEAKAKEVLANFVKTYRDPSYKIPASRSLLDEIWFQRRVELWGEGFYTADARRLGKNIFHRLFYCN